MRPTPFHAAMFLTVLLGPPSFGQASKDKLPSMDEAAEQLQKVLDLKTDSYHVFLRESSLLVPPVLVGQKGDDVHALMKERFRAHRVQTLSHGDTIKGDYLLKQKAVTFPSGSSLDLHLIVTATVDDSKDPTLEGQLVRADVELVAEINAPLERVIAEKRYPDGTLLDAIFRSKEVREEGSQWPLVRRARIRYGVIDKRWFGPNPSGFHVDLDFTASLWEEIGIKLMTIRVVSGLDPLRSRSGKARISKDYRPGDSLGEITSHVVLEG